MGCLSLIIDIVSYVWQDKYGNIVGWWVLASVAYPYKFGDVHTSRSYLQASIVIIILDNMGGTQWISVIRESWGWSTCNLIWGRDWCSFLIHSITFHDRCNIRNNLILIFHTLKLDPLRTFTTSYFIEDDRDILTLDCV